MYVTVVESPFMWASKMVGSPLMWTCDSGGKSMGQLGEVPWCDNAAMVRSPLMPACNSCGT